MIPEFIVERLKQEFTCFYHADVIPENWKSRDVACVLAKESVARLIIDIEEKEELRSLLKILAGNRMHPINEMLSEETDIEWCVEDDDWNGYRVLLAEMIVALET